MNAIQWVRPLVTVIFAVMFCYGFAIGKVSPEVFTTTSAGIIMYWFRARDEFKQ